MEYFFIHSYGLQGKEKKRWYKNFRRVGFFVGKFNDELVKWLFNDMSY